jgi:hypothetical protein
MKKSAVYNTTFIEGFQRELREVQSKQASLEKTREENYLSYLREELFKISGEDQREYIKKATSSRENFEKMAMAEFENVWNGMREELTKQGADEEFFQGMLKEAGIVDLARLAKPLLRWGNIGKTFKALPALFGRGASRAAVSQGGGGLINAAGEAITHSPSFGGQVSGARTYDFLKRFAGQNPVGLSPAENKAFRDTMTGAAGRVDAALGQQGSNAFQQHVLDIKNQAMRPGSAGAAARQHVQDMSAGNFGEAASRMGVHQNELNKLSPHVINDATTSAGNYVKGGFNPTGMTHTYEDFLHPEVLNAKPSGGGHIRFSPGQGLSRAAGWGLTGGMIGGLPGAAVGAGLGGLTGTLGTGGAALAGGAALLGGGYMGAKALGSLFNGGGGTDKYGLPVDRNRAIPGVSNQLVGGAGGAILAHLVGQQLGLQGPAAAILPVLGGMAGYNYFPQMMNKQRDVYGTGLNQMSPDAISYNRSHLSL